MTAYTDLDVLPEDSDISEDIQRPVFNISSFPMDLNLNQLKEMFEQGVIQIPDFQRNYVWTINQASLLIDSFLSGLPVPPIYLFKTRDETNLVIDGQQRVLSIIQYLKGQFGDSKETKRLFRLRNIPKGCEWENKAFTDLSEQLQTKLRYNSTIRAIIVQQNSPSLDEGRSSAYELFERINTGGTPLRPQEIRNAVYAGTFNTQLKILNTDEHWRSILGTTSLDKRERDVEFLLRIFALFSDLEGYEKPLKKFLNETMEKNVNADTRDSKHFSKIFPTVCADIIETIGPAPFRLRGPINVAALDSVLAMLARGYGRYNKSKLAKNWQILQANERFKTCTTTNTTDKATVLERCNLVESIMVTNED